MTTTLYKNTTQEQRKSIAPYLLNRFSLLQEDINKGIKSEIRLEIKAFQQAQKAEIEKMTIIQIGIPKDMKMIIVNDSKTNHLSVDAEDYIKRHIAKLKFESELQ